MNLSQTQITVKKLSIKIFNVKKICKKFNLCFYCKLQHSDFDNKNCFNKNKKKITFHVTKIHDDTVSIDDDIIFFYKKHLISVQNCAQKSSFFLIINVQHLVFSFFFQFYCKFNAFYVFHLFETDDAFHDSYMIISFII